MKLIKNINNYYQLKNVLSYINICAIIILEIDIYVSIRILEKSCRYLRHWLQIDRKLGN